MKRTLLLAVTAASLFFSNRSAAQVPIVGKVLPKVTVGVKVGANFQQLDGSTWSKAYKPGILGGLFVGVSKNKIGVQVEGLVKSVKFDYNTQIGQTSASIKGVYLDIPVLFEYKIIPRLWVQIGPQFSQLISAKQDGEDVKNNFNATDFSGVLGLEARLPIHLTAGARYILGLTDINNASVSATEGSWKNRTIQLYVGFRFL